MGLKVRCHLSYFLEISPRQDLISKHCTMRDFEGGRISRCGEILRKYNKYLGTIIIMYICTLIMQVQLAEEEVVKLASTIFQCGDAVAQFGNSVEGFLNCYRKVVNGKTWKTMRNDTISKLQELADNLDEHHKNVNITNVTASSVSATGGALAVTGTVLSFFTFGLAAPLAVAGTAMAVAGGATGLGASLTEMGITKDRCEEAQKVVNDDVEQTKRVFESITDIQEAKKVLEKKIEALQAWDPSDISKIVDQIKIEVGKLAAYVGGYAMGTAGNMLGSAGTSAGAGMGRGYRLGSTGTGFGNPRNLMHGSYSGSSSASSRLSTGTRSSFASSGVSTRLSTGSQASFTSSFSSNPSIAGSARSSISTRPSIGSVGARSSNIGKLGNVGKLGSVGANAGKVGGVGANVGKVGNIAANVEKVGSIGANIGKVGNVGASVGKFGNIGASMAKIGSVGLKIGGAALSGVGLGLDIWTIVSTAKDMQSGSKSPAGTQLRESATKLQEQKIEIEQLYDSLVSQNLSNTEPGDEEMQTQ